jgi:hypothetical protein
LSAGTGCPDRVGGGGERGERVGGDGDAEGGFVPVPVVPDLESVGVVEVALQVVGCCDQAGGEQGKLVEHRFRREVES